MSDHKEPLKMLSIQSTSAIMMAEELAKMNQHKEVMPEHLLCGLLGTTTMLDLCRMLKIDDFILGEKLIDYVNKHAKKCHDELDIGELMLVGPGYNTQLKLVLRRAHKLLNNNFSDQIHTGLLLLALLQDRSLFATQLLELYGLDLQTAQTYMPLFISSWAKELDINKAVENGPNADSFIGTDDDDDDGYPDFLINMNQEALEGRYSPYIGGKELMKKVFRVITRQGKRSVLLVGHPGVGKTAFLKGLVHTIVNGTDYTEFRKFKFYYLDTNLLLSDTKYRGDMEKKFSDLTLFAQLTRDAVIVVDEFQTFIKNNGWGGTAELVKRLMELPSFKLIGAMTYADYMSCVEKDPALSRRMSPVFLEEPTISEAEIILQSLSKSLEQHHNVKIQTATILDSVEMSTKYIRHRMLPDKAYEILDDACSMAKLENTSKKGLPSVTSRHVLEALSDVTKVPSEKLILDPKTRLEEVKKDLKTTVFGQDEAIDAVTKALKLSLVGMRDHNKPVGSFLFAGPTGVGKTELVKQLGSALGVTVNRFDMGEYTEAHTVSMLLGSPPGYVGYENPGKLYQKVKEFPNGILLFDEIEKAHPDVYNVLLSLMDYGTATDRTGNVIDVRNTYIIMTSNIGSKDVVKSPIGLTYTSSKVNQSAALEIAKKHFSPEFLNRLDHIVVFNALQRENMVYIVKKFLKEIEIKLAFKNIALDINMEAVEWLCKHGYSEQMGARPLARVINNELVEPISDKLLESGNAKICYVSVKNDSLDIDLIREVESNVQRAG